MRTGTTSPTDRLDLQQKAWLAATFDRNRTRFGDLRMEADGDDGGESGSDGEGSGGGQKPFADLSDAEKVDFLLAKTRRQEDALKGKAASPDARAMAKRVKELEAQAEADRELRESLEAASKSEAERAADKAAAEARKSGAEAAAAEAMSKFGPRLVGAEFRAQLAGRMSAEEIGDLVGDLNIARFLGDGGDVDVEAVTAFVARIPAKTVEPPKLGAGDLGGGRRSSSTVISGADLWAQRHAKPAAS